MTLSMLLVSLVTATPSLDGSKGFGIYEVNPALTTGRMEFFREVYVDPENVHRELSPKKPLPGAAPTGELHIRNGSSAWQDVSVNGTRVGKVGPLTTAIIHDLPSGLYEVTLVMPTGFSYTDTVATVAPGKTSPIEKTDAVQPVPIPQGPAPEPAPQ